MARCFLPLLLLALPGGCGATGLEAADLCGSARKAAVADTADGSAALPKLTGRIVDVADILAPATEAAVTRELAMLEQRTTDQVVVVTTPSLRGESIEHYGLRLGNDWGVGQEKLANGVLLIIAPADRKVRIEVGCGLEGLLTDERAAAIIEQTMLPLLRKSDFDQAVKEGIGEIGRTLASETRRPMPKVEKKAA